MRPEKICLPFALVLLLGAAPAHADNLWYKLWYNADQRGERLLKHGDATAAAHVYHDPRRKAYAELRAGDYQNAARDLSAFDDSDSNYNRGNALAQSGQLQEALKAYDAALARNPDNRDARHNRDLVAKALQQQPPQSKPASGGNNSSGNGKDGNKGSSGSAQGGKQGGKQGAGTQGKDGKHPAGKQSGHDQQGKAGQDNGSQQTGPGRQQSAQNAYPQPGSNNQANPSAPSQADEAAQARRDAAARLGKPASGNPQTQSSAPVSEQQLAQEQWLRRIPDDPGGLLRRKFMIEHMIRQQGGQP
jgi:Ca-activated chloride channel homolog